MPTLWDINANELRLIVFHECIYFNTKGKPVKGKPQNYSAFLTVHPSPLIILKKNGIANCYFVDAISVIERICCLDEGSRITVQTKDSSFKHYYFTNEGPLKTENYKRKTSIPCTFCGDQIQKKDDVITCPGCRSIFHQMCWEAANGCLSCRYEDKNDDLYSWVPEVEIAP